MKQKLIEWTTGCLPILVVSKHKQLHVSVKSGLASVLRPIYFALFITASKVYFTNINTQRSKRANKSELLRCAYITGLLFLRMYTYSTLYDLLSKVAGVTT
jgi:cation transport regulator ChaB